MYIYKQPYVNTEFSLGHYNYQPFSSAELSRLLTTVFDDASFGVGRHFDTEEFPDSYVFTLELPGYKSDSLDITVDKNVLTVQAKKGEQSYDQSLTLPKEVDLDKVDAKLEDGILTIKIAKIEKAKPRKIALK